MICIVVLIWTLLCATGLWCWLFGWIVWFPPRLWGGNFLEIWGREVQCLSKWACGDVFCVWAILAILSLSVVFVAKTKNTRKGKASSFSMERAVKKEKC